METWANNDLWLNENLIKEDAALKKASDAMKDTNLPQMEVSPAQGKFLYLLAKLAGAKRILEIGTFYGYSTLWLAKAVPDDGLVISLELTEKFVTMAQSNIANAGLTSRVKLLQGDATKLLKKLIADKTEPFDMIFIDAHKPSYPEYLKLSLQLSKPGTVICGDNIIRNGELANMNNVTPNVMGTREFIQTLGDLKYVESTALQTVGIKGYDGFTISVVGDQNGGFK